MRALSCLMHFELTPFHLSPTPVCAFKQLLVTAHLAGVLLSCPQFSQPGAPLLRVGALHLEITKPSVVEVVWKCGEVYLVDWASPFPTDAFLAEQVPTTGLHRIKYQLHADGALQLLQYLSRAVHKRVVYIVVTELKQRLRHYHCQQVGIGCFQESKIRTLLLWSFARSRRSVTVIAFTPRFCG